MQNSRIYRSPEGEGSGGGGAPDFRSQIPEEFRNEPSLAAVTDLPSLVKGYVHAQRLVGQDKIVLPRSDWTDQDFNNFYAKLGRPESPDKYQLPSDVQLNEGMEFSDEVLGQTRAAFHKLGLTSKQAEGVLHHYITSMNARQEATTAQQQQEQQVALQTLRSEWGDQYDTNLATAKEAVKKFGGDEFLQYLEDSGLGNDLRLIKAFHAVGRGMTEDTTGRGGEGGGGAMNRESALQMINDIRAGEAGEEWSRFIRGDTDLGMHKRNELQQKWSELHKIAYPGTEA